MPNDHAALHLWLWSSYSEPDLPESKLCVAPRQNEFDGESLSTSHAESRWYGRGSALTLQSRGLSKLSNPILRRSASSFTSFITGRLPYAPVPMTNRRHFHGISSSTDKGVSPNS